MKNILILEDNEIIQRLYVRALGSLHTLTVVGTVAQARSALDASRPDVFVSDMRLPDGAGSEAVLHCQKTHPGLPIIIVSGTLEDSKDLHVFRRFEKPFLASELTKAVEEA